MFCFAGFLCYSIAVLFFRKEFSMGDVVKRLRQSWCPVCKGGPAGPDCPDKQKGKRHANKVVRRGAKRDIDRELFGS